MANINKPKNENSRCVFVGNIPYDSSESEIVKLFSNIGKVVSFRTVSDRDTGKPKGYGFCEFLDNQTAVQAIKKLNNTEFYGRSLRVDHATAESNNLSDIGADAERARLNYRKCPLPSEKPTLSEEIVNVVKTFSRDEKLEVLANMKAIAQQNPQGALQLLAKNPQLSQAMLAILIVFELVSVDEVKELQNAAENTLSPPPKKPKLAEQKTKAAPQSPPEPKLIERLPQSQQRMLQKLLALDQAEINELPAEMQSKVHALKQKLSKQSQ